MVAGPRLRCALTTAAVVAAFVVDTVTTSAASPPGQVLTVEAGSPSATVAVVEMWQLTSDGAYDRVGGPFSADVGRHGVGHTREGEERTPSGVFTLTRAFGSLPRDGIRLAYRRTNPDDWWDEDPSTAGYNEFVISRYSPGGDSENLYYAGVAYSHAVVINYNTDPIVRGAGSGFFLHVGDGQATAGCVAVTPRALDAIMRWLNPARHPVISIGVGGAARAILRVAPGSDGVTTTSASGG